MSGAVSGSIDERESGTLKNALDVAVVGMAGRFPGARNVDGLWKNILEGRSAITRVPADRWRQCSAQPADFWGGFINEVDCFDAPFFRISPKEAELMDPQQRILLEVVWHLFENAKIKPSSVAGSKVGAFVGVCNTDYGELISENGLMQSGLYASTGGSVSMLSNRVSYHFDLRGPSLTVDTACSSSLVAVHLAVNAIQSGECSMAIAGGVNVCLTPGRFLAFGRAGMLAKDGQCKTFDARANGYVRGEGIGTVLLKPLSKALADGDRIYGVIRGSAINHGGKTGGLTVTSPEREAELICSAYRRAGFAPSTIGYIEVHGPGTALGDPIEFLGLEAAFEELGKEYGANDAGSGYCALGSIKTYIGHLEAAAGIAGLIKALLSLSNRVIPANLNFQSLNPMIEIDRSPFYLPTSTCQWNAFVENTVEHPRRAGVSSFGYGGAYAHVVVEEHVPEAIAVQASSRRNAEYLLPISARRPQQLQTLVREVLSQLETPCDLESIAYSLQVTREELDERLAVVAASREEAVAKLERYLHAQELDGSVYCGRAERVQSVPRTPIPGSIDKLNDVAQAWVDGAMIDWTALYDHVPSRVSLPLYPFAREKYWLEYAESGAATRSASDSIKQEQVPSRSDLEPKRASKAHESSSFLIFNEDWMPLELASEDRGRASINILVLLGNDAHRDSATAALSMTAPNATFEFVNLQRGDLRDVSLTEQELQLSNALGKALDRVGRIDMVWDCVGFENGSDYKRIGALIRACAKNGVRDARLLIAGRWSTVEQRCAIDSLIGYERSIAMTLPGVNLAVIQEEADSEALDAAQIAHWMHRLWHEGCASRIRSALYSNGRRYALTATEIPEALEEANASTAVRMGGVYLVTGGLGGLGSIFCKYLSERYKARLILIGRSPLDASVQLKLDQLSRNGGEAIYCSADVGDETQMHAAVTSGAARFGRIHGVIHAAGVDDGVSLLRKRQCDQDRILVPKINGTYVLEKALSGHALDFFCHFSSTASVLGDFGSCDYATANRFQLAHAKYSKSKTLAICWPLWADGGMGWSDPSATHLYLNSSGQAALGTTDGIALFEKLLRQHRDNGFSHAVILSGRRERLLQTLKSLASTESGIAVKAAANDSFAHRRNAALKGLSIPECVLFDVKIMAGLLLKSNPNELSHDEHFAEFGFDSIGLADLAREISSRYGVAVTPAIFFSHATLSKLAEYLAREHRSVLADYYQEVTWTSGAAPEMTVASDSNVLSSGFEATSRTGDLDAEGIAIIGMSGRFAGSRSIDEMWRILVEGRQVVEEIPLTRFDWREYFETQDTPGHSGPMKGKTNSKWMGVIPGADEFDPLFFEISPKEAECMDPRQRLLLQESYHALEDAGYGDSQLAAHKTGVFVGVEQGDYQTIVGHDGSITSNHDGILAARLSYFLNLCGPAMAINTACSSGLVALHQACASLRAGECDTAIAGSVNLITTPHWYVGLHEAGMLSPDGRCYAFDKRANGMVPGEAVVALVLKRVTQALADNDRIYAVIRGSGINSDGKTNGLTAPNGAAQSALISAVYRHAGVRPRDVEYVVTHGTGTRLGDPVEVNALREVFADEIHTGPICALTSTKSNFGHAFAASGLLSLVSLVQAMRHEVIPASLHCEHLNDYIDWNNSPFYVNTQNKPWSREINAPRRGAVSAFGMSGTNAHVLVESYDVSETDDRAAQSSTCLITLSGKTETALNQRAHDLIEYLKANGNADSRTLLHSLAYTLAARRQHFSHRCALLVEDIEQTVSLLEKLTLGEKAAQLFRGKVAHDFIEQPAFREYAQQSLIALRDKSANARSYRESLAALAELYCQGYAIRWETHYGNRPPPCARLPGYPFLKNRFWFEPAGRTPPVMQRLGRDAERSGRDFDASLFASVLEGLANQSLDVDAALERVTH